MLADRIREFAYRHFIQPAIAAGKTECWIRAGDIHQKLGLQNRMPAVCGALQSSLFRDANGLTFIRRDGPSQGANARFCFRIERHTPAFEAPSPVESTKVDQARLVHPSQAPDFPADLPPRTVSLVSCVSRKRTTAARAADLYESEWFHRAKSCVELIGCPWFILSAKYGLVEPDRVIEPYDETLNTMGVADRRAWAERVRKDMDAKLPAADCILVLAGQRYREYLMDDLRSRAPDVRVPMMGLRIGEQLSHLGKAGA